MCGSPRTRPLRGPQPLATGIFLLLLSAPLSPLAHSAVVSQYLSYSEWKALPDTTVLGVETFNAYDGPYPDAPVTATTAGVSWSASASRGLYSGVTAGSPVMSVNATSDPLTFFFNYSGGLSGVGANIFVSDFDFLHMAGNVSVEVSLTDASTQSFSRTITSSSEFWGFYSSGARIASIRITPGTGYPENPFASIDNLSFMRNGTIPSRVPESGSSWLALLLAMIGLSRLSAHLGSARGGTSR